MGECALQMQGIVKSYGGVTVLKNVDFSVLKGDIHALIGENGAGKSTLMNILGGVTPMDEGSITLAGEAVELRNPADSQEKGVAFIHQELNVVNDLMVYENMFLGHELRTRLGRLDVERMCAESVKVFERMNVQINPRAMMRDMESSYKQIVEIARSLLMRATLIIMDEPTTSLTQQEAENVFAIMRELTKDNNVTIIFISHKLGEVVDFCDNFTVLRNGEKVAGGSIVQEDGSKIEQADLARFMVGRDVLGVEVYEEHDIGDIVLDVKDICVDTRVKDISLTLRKGEILGVTGLLGDGKVELVRALFGDLPSTGEINLRGEACRVRSPSHARRRGIGYLPPNRKENAIIKDLSVQDNITIVTLDQFRVGPSLSHRRERKAAESFVEKLRIAVANLANPITSLSGGNQQKAVLAKWLNAKPDIMILSNPTQGVDVGAKNEIYAEIMKLAKQGTGVIVTSGEAQEVIKLCDRILVMYHGKLQGEIERKDFSEENIMILSTGGAVAPANKPE
jgi:ribose transport system ATP-binding protein